MKQKNKLQNTIILVVLGLVLVSMFKYFDFLKQPKFIQDKYDTFLSYPGVGGIISILIITAVVIMIFNIWKKSKEEILLENGKKHEVEKIIKLYKEGLLSVHEVNKKLEILLAVLKKESALNKNKVKLDKENELLKQLAELKDLGLLTETEFELKKEQVLSGKHFKTE